MTTPVIPKALIDPSRNPGTSRQVTRVRPKQGSAAFHFHELWAYRELLYFLVWRDVKVRYKQAVIGVAWVVLQPLLTMLVFSVVFGKLIQVPTGDTPYIVFAYVALLPWTFFAAAVGRSSSSVVYDANLITKVYFPRVIIPLAAVLSTFVDFGVSFLILMAMMLILGILPGIWIFTLPLFILLTVLTALAVGLWLSALNVKYRDVNHIIPFLIQMWFFLTPVAYPVTIISERWRLLYGLNPMVGVVEGFRWALLGEQNLSWPLMILSMLLMGVLFVSGVVYFQRMEFEFADVV